MNVILYGATGMVGQGTLRECLADPSIERVLVVGRSSIGTKAPKLQELILKDFLDYSAVESQLAGYDACIFCLGISSVGMSETDYARITVEMPLAAAKVLLRLNPSMRFVYVSGSHADSTETSKTMWARVKGRAENSLFALPFKSVHAFRPGMIQPLNGEMSKSLTTSAAARFAAQVLLLLFPLARKIAPRRVTTTVELGRAMIHVARHGSPLTILEATDISSVVTPE